MTLFARAPLRIDLAGGWSDMPAFADAEGGAVVNAAITLYHHVEAVLGDTRIRFHAVDLDQRLTLPSSREIRYDGTLDVHKAALNMLPVTGGIELFTRSDAPGGSELGEAGALGVALLALLAHARGERYDAEELADFGFALETRELGRPGGRQDPYAAALGGIQALRFSRDGVRPRALTLGANQMIDLAAHVVLLYTGRSHFSSAAHQRVRAAYEREDADISDALRSLRDLATEAEAVLAGGDWRALAGVVDENWRQQQRLDATIATERTRIVEGAVRSAGAWGLKGAGAGAGGCLIAVVPPEQRAAVVRAAEQANATELAFGFAPRGVDVWTVDGGRASPDAVSAGGMR